jgi:geranylgeranyl diphosphate synthase type I
VDDELRTRVERGLRAFLDVRRAAIEREDPSATEPLDEIRRLLDAGGKRIRPAFCYWGFRAAGGADDGSPEAPIVRAAGALELLHTMALVHDDLVDGAKERRGVPTTARWFADRAEELGAPGDPEEFGRATAILVGDLAVVLADRLLMGSGFPAPALADALDISHAVRERMAAGEWLDVAGAAARDPEVARRAAALKGGSYTVEGPLLIGAALAGGADEIRAALSRYGAPLGLAFQLRDDLEDGDAAPGVDRSTVRALVDEAKAALDPALMPADAIAALHGLADLIGR